MLADEIKKHLTVAMKARDGVAKDILRVALGEIQTGENRKGEALTEDEAQKILKKLMKSNEETMGISQDPDTKVKLTRENEILAGLLPRSLSVAEIVALLAPVLEAIKGAKADGPAMGVAMKTLKTAGASVDSKDVSAAVRQIRGA